MYYYLKGFIVDKKDNFIVVDVNGIGYQVYVSHLNDFEINQEKIVYLYHVVREDEEYFVGFNTLKEKDVFVKLISCKGIGPKTALGALRDISVDEFVQIILNEDIKKLKKLNGIGPKAASQIILDLKGSLATDSTSSNNKRLNENQEYAKEGLQSLGFKVKEIEDAFAKINNESLSVEDYITSALRIIKK